MQLLNDGTYEVFTPDGDAVVITFPDLSVLTLKSTFFLSPYYLPVGNIDTLLTSYYSINLLADLQKWGYDTDALDLFMHISVDDLKAAGNSAKFTYKDAAGSVIPFDYSVLPDGVYKVFTSGSGGTVTYTSRVLTTAVSDEYLSTSINSYLLLRADETAYKQDLDNMKDLVLKLMIIQYALRYDFSHGYYSEANIKAASLKTIVDTGVYIFKPGH